MATFANGESGLSVRTKINAVLQHADGTAGALVINDAGADVDFRVESDTNANAIFMDGATGNIGIGTASPAFYYGKLTVTGGNLAIGDGNEAIFWNAAGTGVASILGVGTNELSFTTASTPRMRIDASGRLLIGTTFATGANLLQVNSDARINGLTVGLGAGAIASSTALGTSALGTVNTGTGNTAIGALALTNNTTGTSNTGLGRQTLYTNTTGVNNIGIGENALFNNTTGANNIAAGNVALFGNTTGGGNAAFGYAALYTNTTASNNTGIGFQALQFSTTGVNNTAVGSTAMNVHTTGNNNTSVGTSSLLANTTGSNNTVIGQGAGLALTTGDNNTIIGRIAGTAGLANTVIIGAGATERLRINDVGNMGLGTISITAIFGRTLQVGDGNTASTLSMIGSGAGLGGDLYFASLVDTAGIVARAGTALVFSANDAAEHMRLDTSGRLLVATTSATQVGRAVIKASEAAIIENGGSVAAGGTLDITVSTSATAYWQGILTVINTSSTNGAFRTQSTISCMGNNQFGDFATSTIQSVNGASGDRTFTVTYVATGKIRITNTSAETCLIRVAFFGNGFNLT